MWKEIASVILFASLLTVASGRRCTKEIINSQTLVAENVTECCEGYREVRRTADGPSCDPICDPPCGNGDCYSPNRCACAFGYRHSKEGSCVLNEQQVTTTAAPAIRSFNHPASGRMCARCDRGTCDDSGVCLCPSGYLLNKVGDCQPVCLQSCLNGWCNAPNSCGCKDGYTYDADALECQPLCNGKINGCVRGTCVGFDQCKCDNGTHLLNNELFDCVEGELLEQKPSRSWYIWLSLVLAVAAVIAVGVILRRYKAGKVKNDRLMELQDVAYSEAGRHSSTKSPFIN